VATYVAKPSAPTQDKRWKLVDATMRRVGQHSRGLIETLHTVQESFGYLDEQALRYVAMSLRVPLSRAYGVATFYHFFTLKPAGEHTCAVCTGTACHIKGSGDLLAAAKRELGIRPGHTTPGGEVSLISERCIGPCGLGPVVVYDEEVAAEETAQALTTRLKHWSRNTP
jgi:bidirectional [NiFe] hydrogenase diaphorase subunit